MAFSTLDLPTLLQFIAMDLIEIHGGRVLALAPSNVGGDEETDRRSQRETERRFLLVCLNFSMECMQLHTSLCMRASQKYLVLSGWYLKRVNVTRSCSLR